MFKTKFEAKSKRVKGLSFHKHRPWILASLHNGSINLFDYRAACLLEKFEDHDGPVRGVNFHETQPLFVSGGDDHKVKVWNYKTKKCLFTLTGHLDYIRTVEFHKELPWICSSSDDQTIRIWNWQNRSVIAILTGHSHYVMSATFHPEETLLASASLDQTIRIWDFSRLKEKSMQKSGSRPNEIFGGTEVEVKHIIEGHEKGVNWVSFHPTMKIVASGADDKTIKLWRLSGNKHWEMDTMKGHANNVSCVLFHPRMEILLSNSEDKTLRVWDLNRRVQIHQMRKDTDRFWILCAHPSLNYFAAGYDNGMMVFKLERENYASVRMGSNIFFVKNKNLYFHDLSTKEKTIMAAVNTNGKQVFQNQPKSIYYNFFNQSSHDIILNFDVEGGCFIIYEFHRDLKQIKCTSEKRGDYTQAAVFLSKDKICVLDANKELAVCNFDGSNMKKFTVNKKGPGKIEMIYPGPLGKILFFSDDALSLYDITARKVLHEVSASDVKAVYWNNNFTYAAIVTKTQLIMVNKNLDVMHSQKENSKIKTGCFDENNAFIYSTSTHIKYMFCEGKTTGTFKSIEEPLYVSFVIFQTSQSLQFMKNVVYAFNRSGETVTIEVNNTDYLFKIALQQKNFNEVKEILSQGNLCGHSIVSYLKDQGHSEIALFFEQDLKQRFNLAIASGNVQVAFDAAKDLKEKDNFIKLAQTALLLGNNDITEKCYQIVRSLDKLNFFYATTGSISKMKKMQAVAQNLNDHTLRFNTAIYIGDVQERIKVLAETGQIPLAYLMARSHGQTEFAKTLEDSIRQMDGVDPDKIIEQADAYSRRGKAMLPLRPLYIQNESFQQRDWPMINLRAKEAERAASVFQKRREPELADNDDMFFDAKEFHSSNKQVANILATNQPTTENANKSAGPTLNVENANWGDDDLDIDADDMLQDAIQTGDDMISADTGLESESSDIFVPPSQGSDPLIAAVRKNPLIAGYHVATGDFQKALELLKKQLAVTNYEPLRQLFVDIYTLTKMKIQTVPHANPIDYQLRQQQHLPQLAINMSNIMEKYNKGIELTTQGEFGKALDSFRSCLQGVPLLVVSTQKEQKELQEIIRKISEYITAMRIELERKRLISANSQDNVRMTELSCYMTLCAMDVAHKFLAYKNAMNNNYKMQNFITAANFARLILELEPTGIFASKPETIPQFKKYYQAFQQKGTNAQKLNFDPSLNVELKEVNGYLDIGTLTPLEDSKSQNTVRCPLDGSVYHKSYAGKVCETCQLCQLGQDAMGLTVMVEGSGHLE